MSDQIEAKSAPTESDTLLPALLDQMTYYFVPLRLNRTLLRAVPGWKRRIGCRETIQAIRHLHIGDLVSSSLIPDRLRAHDEERRRAYHHAHLWEPGGRMNDHGDLQPHVLAMLGHGSHQAGNRDCGPHHVRLTADAINILTGRWGQRGPGMSIGLPPRSRQRSQIESQSADGMASEPPGDWQARLLVESVDLYLSPLGHGVLIVGGKFKARVGTRTLTVTRPELLLECNHQLVSSVRSQATPPIALDEGERFSIPGLAKVLLCNSRAQSGSALPQVWDDQCERLFTYTYVNLATAIATDRGKSHFLTRLTRRFTNDYSGDGDYDDMRVRAVFSNVTHTATREGGACLVETVAHVQFVEDYLNVVRSTYLPMSILAYQESMFLHDQTAASVAEGHFDLSRHSVRQLGRLRALVSRSAWFRLLYRFSDVARLDQQQRVYSDWRKALNLDARIKELDGDVAAAKTLLLETKKRWITLLGVAVGAFFAAKEFGDIILEAVFDHADVLRIAQTEVFRGTQPLSHLERVQEMLQIEHRVMLLLAGAVAVAAFYIVNHLEFWEAED